MNKVTPKDYRYGGYSAGSVPFTDAELAIVSDEIKALMVQEARYRFPATSKLVANAMIGAVAMILRAAAEIER